MAEGSSPARRRIAVLAGLLAVALVGLAVTDREGRVGLIGRCVILGQGRAWLPYEPRDFQADFFGMQYTGNTSSFIDAHVLLYGGYERHVLHAMADAVHAIAPASEAVAVDVGANVGHHTMFLSKEVHRVVAVEPFPPVVDRMRGMLADNGITNVDVHALGYSNEAGTLPFHVPPDYNPGMGSFAGVFQGSDDRTVLELPLVRGDDDLADDGPIHLIKIDIEGYEKYAFEGLSHTMRTWRPAVVMELNVTNEEGFHSEAELRAAFPEGYEFFLIDGGPERRWELPGGRLFCASPTGDYVLRPFDMTFDVDQRNLLAMPSEHVSKLTHVAG